MMHDNVLITIFFSMMIVFSVISLILILKETEAQTIPTPVHTV